MTRLRPKQVEVGSTPIRDSIFNFALVSDGDEADCLSVLCEFESRSARQLEAVILVAGKSALYRLARVRFSPASPFLQSRERFTIAAYSDERLGTISETARAGYAVNGVV